MEIQIQFCLFPHILEWVFWIGVRENWFSYSTAVIKIQKLCIFQRQTAFAGAQVRSLGLIPASVSVYLLWCWPTLTTVELIRISTAGPWMARATVTASTPLTQHAFNPCPFWCQCSVTVLQWSKLLFVAVWLFLSLVLICSSSHGGMGARSSVLGACWAARYLQKLAVVVFSSWCFGLLSENQRKTQFLKVVEVFIFTWSEKAHLISRAVFTCGLRVYCCYVLLPFTLFCSFCTVY